MKTMALSVARFVQSTKFKEGLCLITSGVHPFGQQKLINLYSSTCQVHANILSLHHVFRSDSYISR